MLLLIVLVIQSRHSPLTYILLVCCLSMSRGEFGGGPSYGTLSDSNVAVSYDRPSSSRYGGNELFDH